MLCMLLFTSPCIAFFSEELYAAVFYLHYTLRLYAAICFAVTIILDILYLGVVYIFVKVYEVVCAYLFYSYFLVVLYISCIHVR